MIPFSQGATAVVTGFLLFVGAGLYWVSTALGPVLEALQREQAVAIYLSPQSTEAEEKVIRDQLNLLVGAGAARKGNVSVIERREFLESLQVEHPQLVKELVEMGDGMKDIVPRYFSFLGSFDHQMKTKIESLPGVEGVESSKDRYLHVTEAFQAVRWVSRILLVGLILVLWVGMLHLSRLNGFLNADSRQMLKHWGASSLEMSLPLWIASSSVGVMGGLVGAVFWVLLAPEMAVQFRTLSPLFAGMPTPDLFHGFFLVLGGGILGLLSGIFSAMTGAEVPVR